MKNFGIKYGAIAGLSTLLVSCATAQQPSNEPLSKLPARQMEKLGRGVVAIPQNDGKVWLSWRLLVGDADATVFDVFRSTDGGKAVRLNTDRQISGGTNFVDATANLTRKNTYSVRVFAPGKPAVESAPVVIAANALVRPYLSVALQTPEGYTPNDASVADLDGDGEYEIVLHQTGRAKDNSQAGVTDPPILQAYKLDGRLLWSVNLGVNIREGAHYTQFMVYDLDGDGRAEMVCKTADGTVDGAGQVLGDASANYLDANGYILRGPEYLSVFDGLSGKILATTPYLPGRYPGKTDPTSDELKAEWGDGYGNRVDRFLACVAYLDGVHPSVVMCRGYYTRTVLAAFDWRGGKFSNRWVFDSNAPGNAKYAGQGNHSLIVADVDADGRDEIVYGKMAVDDNGRGLYSTGIGHGDAAHLSDLDPARPGLEVFSIQEPFADAGAHIFDARTGEILWKKASVTPQTGGKTVEGPGRGLALDIDPRYPGFESWAAGAGLSNQLWNIKGEQIGNATPSVNFGVFWDGDTLSELLDGTTISKWDFLGAKPKTLLDGKAFGVASNNGTKATPALSADILGDWREEVIWRSDDNRELRIFTTTVPTALRLPCLMQDPQYRLSVAWQNVGYNQPPHTSFYMGAGMKTPPRPNIVAVVPAKARVAAR